MSTPKVKLSRIEKYRARPRGTAPSADLLTVARAAFLFAAIGSSGATGWQLGKIAAAPPASADDGAESSSLPDAWDSRKLSEEDSPAGSALGLVTQDGLSPLERAAKAAEAAEAKRLADEESAKAEDAERESAEAHDSASGPSDFMASQSGGRGGPFRKKFGTLTPGGGTGSGMANAFHSLGSSGRPGGGRGGRALSEAAKEGKLGASRSAVALSTSKGAAGKGGLKTRQAYSQLNKAGEYAGTARVTGDRESAVKIAAASFDSGRDPGDSNAASGNGAYAHGGASGRGPQGSNAGANAAGGPIGGASRSGTCGRGQFVGADGTCAELSIPKGAAMTPPYQPLIDMANGLLKVIAVLGILVMIFQKMLPWGPPVAAGLRRTMGVLGLIVTGLGMAIMAMGQTLQGQILTALGAIIAALSFAPDTKTASQTEVLEKKALENSNAERVIGEHFRPPVSRHPLLDRF